MMDKLVDLDEERLVSLDIFITQNERVSKAYNKKIKSKVFSIGDYVSKLIFPKDRKDIALGKWSPNW